MIAERVMWEDFLLKGKPEGVEATHEPTWHPFPAMKALPRGWYWAPFPGDWVWYCPERNMARGIDHGDTNWHDLQSVRYWGPWVPPTTAA
jgi:hypothetical protein